MKRLVLAAAAAVVLLGSVGPGAAKVRHKTTGAPAAPVQKFEGRGTFDQAVPPPAYGPSPEQLRMDREDT